MTDIIRTNSPIGKLMEAHGIEELRTMLTTADRKVTAITKRHQAVLDAMSRLRANDPEDHQGWQLLQMQSNQFLQERREAASVAATIHGAIVLMEQRVTK